MAYKTTAVWPSHHHLQTCGLFHWGLAHSWMLTLKDGRLEFVVLIQQGVSRFSKGCCNSSSEQQLQFSSSETHPHNCSLCADCRKMTISSWTSQDAPCSTPETCRRVFPKSAVGSSTAHRVTSTALCKAASAQGWNGTHPSERCIHTTLF